MKQLHHFWIRFSQVKAHLLPQLARKTLKLELISDSA
jgi:hypothetical protein